MERIVFAIVGVLLCAASVYCEHQCYTCSNQAWNYNCRQQSDLVKCSFDQYCLTEITNDHGDLVISKQCKEANACLNLDDNNHRYCDDGIVKSKCRYCCSDDLCNDDITHYHEVFDKCGPWSRWSDCVHCKRTRTRTCGESSKSGSKSGSHSGSHSGSRHRRDDFSDEETDDEMRDRRSKSGSRTGSSEIYTEGEEDNCCQTTCHECDSVIMGFNWAPATFAALVLTDCPAVTCPTDLTMCSTTYTFDMYGIPSMTKGCVDVPTADAYLDESSEACPHVVMNDVEAAFVGLNLEAGTMCHFSCDNGPDENNVICNSGLVPPWKYIYNSATYTAASVLATAVLAMFASVFLV